MVWSFFVEDIMGGVVGGGSAYALPMTVLFGLSLLVIVLLAARLDISFAFLLVSPALVVAASSGYLPPSVFGITVIILALFFVSIIVSLMR